MPNLWPHFHFPRAGALSLAAALALGALSSAALPAQDQDLAAPHVTASGAAQIGALVSIKQASSPAQKKIDSALLLGLLHQRNDPRLASLTSYEFLRPDTDGRVVIELPLISMSIRPKVEATIQALGGTILHRGKGAPILLVRVRLSDVETLAALPEIRRVRQYIPPAVDVINVSEGVLTHSASEARNFFGTTGAGVKIGVISNGVDSLASLQASGDLPAVTVLPGQEGSGEEGNAMLEIVHDMAPDAQLYYASAFPTADQFAQNILDLAAAGCTVIVDDIFYFAESPFQDWTVAQAVNTVTANGVAYFASAGNSGNLTDGTSGVWEGDFSPNGTIPSLPAGSGTAHNFGNGGQSILVTKAAPQLILNWAEHSTLTQGLATYDYDLYRMNAALSGVIAASTGVQDGVGGDDFPFEFLGGANAGERLVVLRFAAGTTSSPPMLHLIANRGQVDPALAMRGATRGHNSSVQAFGVAATPAAASFDGVSPAGPYPGEFHSGNQTERFTSDGPRRIILRADGSEITPGNRTKTGGTVRQKPDIAAADGVSCAAPGFATFYGTSAAAPHAAAIAVLLKSALPGITLSELREALVTTALDIEAPGTDGDTGAGIVMPHAALDRAGAAGPLKPAPMEVDAHAVAGDSSNHNGVFEPAEIVEISPSWKNNQAGPQPLSGVATNFTGPAGPFYSLANGTAAYGTIGANATNSCHTASGDCYLFGVAGTRPIAHWDATFTETLSVTLPKLWKLHIGNTFPDVPNSNPFYPFIENLIHNGVTGGCGGGNYCPGNPVTRAQMAIFLLKGKHGSTYIPPPCTGMFTDVSCTPASAFAVDWIEQLAEEGITGGCGPSLYCPGNPVTRAQMAVFLLKAEHGSAYVPPACTGIFPDVACTPTPAFAVDWIEQLYHEGITGGCAGGGYCPGNTVLRSQMAVFLVKTFGLSLYGL